MPADIAASDERLGHGVVGVGSPPTPHHVMLLDARSRFLSRVMLAKIVIRQKFIFDAKIPGIVHLCMG